MRGSGVRLGIEPLHPMFAADRSVIVTLAEALDLAMQFDPADVGGVIDVFHAWWDARLYDEIRCASGRILSYHVSDWAVPLPGILTGHSMMGEGVIELRRIRNAVEESGYQGPIEVEILNQAIWDQQPDCVLKEILQRYLRCV